MNWYGLYTLFSKEVWRFLKVAIQTLLTPIVTVLLYLLVFSSVLSSHVQVYESVDYAAFLVPGLIMMTIIQNAFANTSSSLFQAKTIGSIVFILLAPLSSWECYLAYVGAAVVRGLLVGIGVWIAALWFVHLPLHNLLILLIFSILGSAILGTLGIIGAIVSEKWDHLSAFQNFVILPLSFLSGVFYSVNNLPGIWREISHYNPFFYMIDGFRYGFLGVSDVPIITSLWITTIFMILVAAICLRILQTGYKVRG